MAKQRSSGNFMSPSAQNSASHQHTEGICQLLLLHTETLLLPFFLTPSPASGQLLGPPQFNVKIACWQAANVETSFLVQALLATHIERVDILKEFSQNKHLKKHKNIKGGLSHYLHKHIFPCKIRCMNRHNLYPYYLTLKQLNSKIKVVSMVYIMHCQFLTDQWNLTSNINRKTNLSILVSSKAS